MFKKKLRPDGLIEKYKARFVAKGYAQKKEEDFFDTYSHVARLITIRVLLSLMALHDLLIHQIDIKTAFLNVELDEKIYVQQTDDFVIGVGCLPTPVSRLTSCQSHAKNRPPKKNPTMETTRNTHNYLGFLACGTNQSLSHLI